MKELFTIKQDGTLWIESEGSVYRQDSFSGKKRTYYDSDSEGNVSEN